MRRNCRMTSTKCPEKVGGRGRASAGRHRRGGGARRVRASARREARSLTRPQPLWYISYKEEEAGSRAAAHAP